MSVSTRMFAFIAAIGLVVGLVSGIVFFSIDLKRVDAISCQPVPRLAAGSDANAALAVASETALRYVRDGVLGGNPRCVAELGPAPVVVFETGSSASVLNGAQIALVTQEGFRQTADGFLELPLFVGLTDPEVGQVVYQMVLRLARDRWSVVEFAPAGFGGGSTSSVSSPS
jgi:hypothetical protein